MMRSWASATSAPMAIFGSNLSEMYAVTRTRNTIRAMIALWEMVPPHVGPTSVSLISLGLIPATSANWLRSRSARGVTARAAGGAEGDAALPDGVGAALADGVGAAEGEAVGVGPALADGDGATEGVGLGGGMATATSPNCCRLLLLIVTQPWGHWPPPRTSTFDSRSPNRFSTRWKSATVAPLLSGNWSCAPPLKSIE